jgi:hypothetical protein
MFGYFKDWETSQNVLAVHHFKIAVIVELMKKKTTLENTSI